MYTAQTKKCKIYDVLVLDEHSDENTTQTAHELLALNWTSHSNLKLCSHQRHIHFVAQVGYFKNWTVLLLSLKLGFILKTRTHYGLCSLLIWIDFCEQKQYMTRKQQLPRLSQGQQKIACGWLHVGKTQINVACVLNVSLSTISCLWTRFQRTGSSVGAPRTGWPRITIHKPRIDSYGSDISTTISSQPHPLPR
jgi:hypothetical protein